MNNPKHSAHPSNRSLDKTDGSDLLHLWIPSKKSISSGIQRPGQEERAGTGDKWMRRAHPGLMLPMAQAPAAPLIPPGSCSLINFAFRAEPE